MYLNRLEFKNDAFRGIDPRCRIGAGAGLILCCLTLSNPLLLALLILAAAVPLLRDLRRLLARLLPVNLFALFLVLTLIPVPGGGFGNQAGPAVGLLLALRLNAAALISMALIIPLGIGGLTNALLKLRCPEKLAALFLLTYRALFVMYRRIFVSVASLKLRQPRQHILGQWRSYAAVFGTALAGAFRRSGKIGRALKSRGFDGSLPITRDFVLKPGDLRFLACSLLTAAALWALDRYLRAR
ncbi:MAG: energy-coupling factor transporter transmembrane protein EcfT [Spirochaetaceae bacterium]|jgi:energy-coupling factor transporter transmembrane protein EcfT|nr:energy-coupling factor transporter transmembrane protein EcfT [Spirochaetaceae bacterium]